MAYVFGGVYIPLSCKLVELALLKGNFSNDDITKHLPGDNFSRSKTGSVKVSTLKKNKTNDTGSQIAIIYFIGGVTYSEIAALRFWARRNNFHFIFATTAIVNGERLLSSFIADV